MIWGVDDAERATEPETSLDAVTVELCAVTAEISVKVDDI